LGSGWGSRVSPFGAANWGTADHNSASMPTLLSLFHEMPQVKAINSKAWMNNAKA
jgi:hypothetical protein